MQYLTKVNSYFKVEQYFTILLFYCIFYLIDAVLLSIRHKQSLKKNLNMCIVCMNYLSSETAFYVIEAYTVYIYIYIYIYIYKKLK